MPYINIIIENKPKYHEATQMHFWLKFETKALGIW